MRNSTRILRSDGLRGNDGSSLMGDYNYKDEAPEVEVVEPHRHSPPTSNSGSDGESKMTTGGVIDFKKHRYPFSIVWTPIPLLTWLFPFIGHMGICYSSGIIRDFAGPYSVTEDDMAFGNPTKYWTLNPTFAVGGVSGWDRAVYEASEEYKTRVHNLICDNCHSHCAYALNLMTYKGSKSWNMVWLTLYMMLYSKFVGMGGFLKTWVPFLVIVTVITVVCILKA